MEKTKIDKNDTGKSQMIPALLLLLLFGVATLLRIPELWGINLLKFYEPAFGYIAIAILAVMAVPQISRYVIGGLGEVSKHLLDKDRARTNIFIICGLILGVLFVLFNPATTLLGDAALRINQINNGRLFLPTELGDFFIHSALHQYLFSGLGFSHQFTYSLIGVLSGLAFCYGVYRLARLFGSDRLIIIVLMLLSSSVMVLFFGYIESYAIITAIIPYLILGGYRWSEGESGPLSYIILVAITGIMHSAAVILFLPSVVFLLLVSKQDRVERLKSITRALLALGAAVIVVLYLAEYLDLLPYQRYLMPLVPHDDYRQGILSLNHLLNLLNWALLTSPVILWLMYKSIFKQSSENPNHATSRYYLLWLVIPSLFFVFFFTPQLGGPRDWDLFSLPMFIILVSLTVQYFKGEKNRIDSYILPFIVCALILTVSFVGINYNPDKAVVRFAEIIEISRFKNLTKEYLTLANQTVNSNEERLKYLNSALQEPPYARNDSITVLNDIVDIHLAMDNRNEAEEYIRKVLAVDSLDLKANLSLIDLTTRYGRPEQMRTIAEMVSNRFPDEAIAQMNVGLAYMMIGDREKWGAAMDRAYRLKPDHPLILINYGIFNLQTGSTGSAIDLLEQAVNLGDNSFLVNYSLALAYHQIGDVTRRNRYINRAGKSATNLVEQQQLDRFLSEIR